MGQSFVSENFKKFTSLILKVESFNKTKHKISVILKSQFIRIAQISGLGKSPFRKRQ